LDAPLLCLAADAPPALRQEPEWRAPIQSALFVPDLPVS
jgi:hypothetical protein